MIVLAITGGSGCGKTTVSEIFRAEGIDVIDTDKVARLIVEPRKPALNEICKEFGEDYLNTDGTLIRSKLAETVFSDSEKLKILNNITHKYIAEYVDEYIIGYSKDILGIDGAVIIESGISYDYLLSVIADKEERIKRIVKRDNISHINATNRIKSQKDDTFYIEKSDYIVYNNTNSEDLSSQIKKIIKDLRSKL